MNLNLMENQVKEATGPETQAFRSLNRRIEGADVTDEPGIQTSSHNQLEDENSNLLPDSNSNENI